MFPSAEVNDGEVAWFSISGEEPVGAADNLKKTKSIVSITLH